LQFTGIGERDGWRIALRNSVDGYQRATAHEEVGVGGGLVPMRVEERHTNQAPLRHIRRIRVPDQVVEIKRRADVFEQRRRLGAVGIEALIAVRCERSDPAVVVPGECKGELLAVVRGPDELIQRRAVPGTAIEPVGDGVGGDAARQIGATEHEAGVAGIGARGSCNARDGPLDCFQHSAA